MTQFLSFLFQQRKTGPNRPSDGKFMAVLRECSRFRVLHTRRPGNFFWIADIKLLWNRSSSSETRQQENARDHVLSTPYVSQAMKEMRRLKRNPYDWTVQALETSLFFCNFIGRSNQLNSPPTAQFLSFSFQQRKTGPNRPSNAKFMIVLRDYSCFHALHTRRPGKFCWNEDRKPQWARSCSIETRQQENARDRVPSAPQVSKPMKEIRRQKRNPCHWTVQVLETSLFFCNFIGWSNQLNSPPMAQFLSFSFKKKLAPIGRRMENLWPFYPRALVFMRYTKEAKKILLEWDRKLLWNRSCSLDTRQQENARDHVQALETSFFV